MGSDYIAWPYPIDYENIKTMDADVLIIGGGIAGSWAALAAVQSGVSVVLVEEMDVFAAGPSGVDHIVYALDNPCCKISPEEFIDYVGPWQYWDYINGISHYVMYKEGYDMLCEIEKMGAKIRDTEDEFKGADFRDEKSKLLFAYDYDTKHTIRVWGATFRPALTAQLKKQKVKIQNRTKVTSLLTEGGKPGGRVIGATGFNVRTGEFFVFRAKATVLATGRAGERVWNYRGGALSTLPRSSGGGLSMAWEAGAELTNAEGRVPSGGDTYPMYGTGNPLNTWYPCTMVDSQNRPIPYMDGKGNELLSFEERVHPSLLGQKFFLERSYRNQGNPVKRPVSLCHTDKFAELIKQGRFTLPLYADLGAIPAHERRAIWGLMIPNEGTTWILYKNYGEAGFDPEKDILQAYSGGISSRYGKSLMGTTKRGYSAYLGGLVHNWDFRTSLEGLYAAGEAIFSVHYHGLAATSGRWAGAKAADYAKTVSSQNILEAQVEDERNRVYAPIRRNQGITWKEHNSAVSTVMSTYGGDTLTDELLKIGLLWLNEIEEKENNELVAKNPRELARCLQSVEVLKNAQMWTHAALSRKASCKFFSIERLEYPENDPKEWHKFITIRKENDSIMIGELPLYFWLQAPFDHTYEENYATHCPWRKR